MQNESEQIRVKLKLLGFVQVRRANGRKRAWFEAGSTSQHGVVIAGLEVLGKERPRTTAGLCCSEEGCGGE